VVGSQVERLETQVGDETLLLLVSSLLVVVAALLGASSSSLSLLLLLLAIMRSMPNPSKTLSSSSLLLPLAPLAPNTDF